MADEDDEWLAGRRRRLQPGPLADAFAVPPDVSVHPTPEALRFHGPALAIAKLADEFRKLERSSTGSEARVGTWTLRVDDDPPKEGRDGQIVMPWHAWGIVASLFRDVAYGYESNPLDFSESGYLSAIGHDGRKHPWPRPDIGVVVEGPIATDEVIDTSTRPAGTPPPIDWASSPRGPSYDAVRKQQLTLLACAAFLGALLFGLSIYFFVEWRLAGHLQHDGVYADAVVQTTDAQRAIVTFADRDGVAHRVTIDRLGSRLCPHDVTSGGCAGIPRGLHVAIVYDPHNPQVAAAADAVHANHWRNTFIGSIIGGLTLLLLAVGRWRWIKKLRALEQARTPVQRMRIIGVRGTGWAKANGSEKPVCRARVQLRPLPVGPPIVTTLFPASGIGGLTPGLDVDVIGATRPNSPVVVCRNGRLYWPARKTRAALQSGHTPRRLRLQADYQCWPLWWDDDIDVGNIDPASLPISSALRDRLGAYATSFDNRLDWHDPGNADRRSSDPDDQAWEDQGRRLAADLQHELRGIATVWYWRDV